MAMNNKKRGTAFEKYICGVLAKDGYWVHFLSPDERGAQPFDIIFAKDNEVAVLDCKTCEDHIFRIGRLEDNQVLAFEKWLKIVNLDCLLAVLHDEKVYLISYNVLKVCKKINLDTEIPWLKGVTL